MREHRLDLTFYGRTETLMIPAEHQEFSRFLDSVKLLAAGDKRVAAYYLFTPSNVVGVLVSVSDVQTAHAVIGGDGYFGDILADRDVALFLRGRAAPLLLRLPPQGPLGDMLQGLADTLYGDAIPTCVMLADELNNPVFFRLDEVQYAVFRSRILTG
jgi:hypothetical protein